MDKNEISAYLENICLILLAILFFAFPLLVTPITTDPFALPKEILLAAITVISLLFLGAKMISDGNVKIRRTPFDLPVLLFGAAVFLSTIFAVNKFDALTASVPFLFSILAYFLVTNFVKTKQSFFVLLTALVSGACVSAFLTILSFFKIYILPFPFTKTPSFTPFGSLLDQLMYLVIILPIAVSLAWPILKSIPTLLIEPEETEANQDKPLSEKLMQTIGFSIASLIIVVGIGVIIYQVAFAKPQTTLLVLPFEVGFQTAFAAVSQDVGRVAQGFFLGSGYGTYATDFTRYKAMIPFNLNETLWSLTFFRSSSFILELLATTGILGVAAFIFIVIKIIKRAKDKYTRDNPIFFSLIFVIIASFFLPFSPVMQTVLFFILGIFSVAEGLNLKGQAQFFDIELHFVAFKRGINPFMASPVDPNSDTDLLSASTIEKIEDKTFTKALPVAFFVIFLIFGGILAFLTYRYVASDILFQDSIVAASLNDGLKTYNDETNAINTFTYRDAYYRIYSQTNLALANNLASQLTQNASPSAQTQQTILSLIQQSINTARNATIISPITSANWQNLSSIYRSLIGFGKGADDFAIASQQQAIALDSNNPQEYIILGGIYYQLAKWDLAQQEFQRAINLKPDFANAYYNLGHTLEAKGDLQNAVLYYQQVKVLVANSPADNQKISAEIDAIQKKIGAAEQAKNAGITTPAANTQPALNLNTAPAKLPERKPPVLISPPPAASSSAQ